MAMTLTDVVKELEFQTEYLDLTNDNLKSFTENLEKDRQKASLDNRENKSENGNYQNTVIGLLEEIRDGGGIGGGGGGRDNSKFGDSFKAGMGDNAGRLAGAGLGIAAIGAGIGAFITALAVSDAAIQKYGGDMSGIKNVVLTTGEIFDELSTEGMVGIGALLAAGGAMGALLGPGGSMEAGFGMFTLGAGIGGFFTGIALNDAAIAKYGGDGSSLVPVVRNTMEALEIISSSDAWKPLAATLAIGALFGQKPAAALAGGLGMGLIGLGIGGFFAGLAIGSKGIEMLDTNGSGLKDLMKNTGEGISALTNALDGNFTNLVGFPAAAGAIATGMGLLTAGTLVSDIGNFASSFFRGENEKSVFERVAEDMKVLNAIDFTEMKGFDTMATSMRNLAAGMNEVAESDVGDFNKKIKDLADNMQVLTPLLSAMWEGEEFKDKSGFIFDTNYDFRPGLKDLPINEIGSAMSTFGSISSTKIPSDDEIANMARATRALSAEGLSASPVSDRTDQVMEQTDVAPAQIVVGQVGDTVTVDAKNQSQTSISGSNPQPLMPITEF